MISLTEALAGLLEACHLPQTHFTHTHTHTRARARAQTHTHTHRELSRASARETWQLVWSKSSCRPLRGCAGCACFINIGTGPWLWSLHSFHAICWKPALLSSHADEAAGGSFSSQTGNSSTAGRFFKQRCFKNSGCISFTPYTGTSSSCSLPAVSSAGVSSAIATCTQSIYEGGWFVGMTRSVEFHLAKKCFSSEERCYGSQSVAEMRGVDPPRVHTTTQQSPGYRKASDSCSLEATSQSRTRLEENPRGTTNCARACMLQRCTCISIDIHCKSTASNIGKMGVVSRANAA